MDFLVKVKFSILLLMISLFCVKANAQSNSYDNEELKKAFKQSYTFESRYQYTEAISVLKNLNDAKSYEINLRLGWLYYLNKQYDESMNYYQIANDIMPNSIEAKFGYINPASASEDWIKVAAKYDEILKIDPQNTKANYNMGLIYYYRPDYNDAYKCFEKVVNLYPFDYDSNLMFAWSNYQLGKYSEAKQLFNKVLLLSPSDASANQGLNLLKDK